jgi:pimeloyl-ACP methyl ester carboxylesterase
VALHGGGARARYWDSPVDPEASLLRAGAAAGWQVVVPDRPGYGASAHLQAAFPFRAPAQAEIRDASG